MREGLSTVTVVLLLMTGPEAGLPDPPGRRLRPRLALSYDDGLLSEKPNG